MSNLIMNEPDVMHIVRHLEGKDAVVEHNLGVMEWDSETQNLTYTGYGRMRTVSELCRRLSEKFD